MVKTRSQLLRSRVKREEHEDRPRPRKLVRVAIKVQKNKYKITKNRKPMPIQVKIENTDSKKALLAPPLEIFTKAKTNITAEQLEKLINHIVNDKMSVSAASRKVGISPGSAYRYYDEYRNDPEHKIPVPSKGLNKQLQTVTQQKIEAFIRYVDNDGMTLTHASKKAGLSRSTATRYYEKYSNDPERKIPLPNIRAGNTAKRCTREEVANLIRYIVNDKMSLEEASKKANMMCYTGKRYYLKYLNDPNHEIPDPHESIQRAGKPCTDDQVKSLIRYIINDGMTVIAASVKADMGVTAAHKYLKQYLDDPKNKIPISEIDNSSVVNNQPTFDQVKNFFRYIIIDRLNVVQAAHIANIPKSFSYECYDRYLKNRMPKTEMEAMSYSIEKMKRLVELVQNEKKSLEEAAYAVHLNINSARQQYSRYLENSQFEIPTNKNKKYTQEDIKKLIGYIENGEMSVNSAAKTIDMDKTSAHRYYRLYKDDPKRKIPAPKTRNRHKKNREFHKYAQIVSDIYKSNPSIKPVYTNCHSERDGSDINIKKEPEDIDTKTALKTDNQ